MSGQRPMPEGRAMFAARPGQLAPGRVDGRIDVTNERRGDVCLLRMHLPVLDGCSCARPGGDLHGVGSARHSPARGGCSRSWLACLSLADIPACRPPSMAKSVGIRSAKRVRRGIVPRWRTPKANPHARPGANVKAGMAAPMAAALWASIAVSMATTASAAVNGRACLTPAFLVAPVPGL